MLDFRKRYEASLVEYQKALDLKSDFAKALKGMGKVCLETGRLVQARKCLEAARRADPELLEAWELLNDLTRVEDAKKIREVKARVKRTKTKKHRQSVAKDKRRTVKSKIRKSSTSRRKGKKKKSKAKKVRENGASK